MRAAIIEDNPSVKRTLIQLIKDYCPEVSIVGEAENVKEGIQLLENLKTDIVFLDVEMPDGTGFDILKNIENIDFQVIFTTSHEKYAIKAIKYSAIDFLLKPVDPEELVEAIDKAKQNTDQNYSTEKIANLLKTLESKSEEPKSIILRDKYGIQSVDLDEITHLESHGSYTKFYLTSGETLMISKGLKEYESLLPNEQFFRCHQSYLINMNYLKRYDKRDGDYLILKDGSKVPLASRKKEVLLQKFG